MIENYSFFPEKNLLGMFFLTRRMQFWRTCILFCQCFEIFPFKLRKGKKKHELSKKMFRRKSLWLNRMPYQEHYRKQIGKNTKNLSLQGRKWSKNVNFPKKLSFKSFSGNEECSYGNQAGIFYQKAIFFDQLKFFQITIVPKNVSLDKKNADSINLQIFFPPKNLKRFTAGKWSRKWNFGNNCCSLEGASGQVECSFDNSAKNCVRSPKSFLSQSESKFLKNYVFFSKVYFSSSSFTGLATSSFGLTDQKRSLRQNSGKFLR